jgi:hypothetical protein
MQWVPNEKKEQPEQEPDDLTIAYMAGFYDGKNTPQRKPEQEPVAWMDECGDVLSASVVDGSGLRNIPLYTAPPQREWVGLTDEERHDIREWQMIQEKLGPAWAPMMLYLYEAIEAKLREKNT